MAGDELESTAQKGYVWRKVGTGLIDMERWTQDEALAFEAAREAVTHLRAILTSEIAEEEAKHQPDAARLSGLRDEQQRLFQERAKLRLHDHAEVARVRAEYGARIRAWRGQHKITVE